MTSLQTQRLIVRDYLKTDITGLHELLSDKTNMYFLDDIVSNSLEASQKNLEAAMSNADGHYFCVCNKTTGEFIGSVGYTITADTPLGKVVHMGYFILPKHQGQGYTTEAVKKVIEFAFTQDDCIRITTGCYEANIQSKKVMDKVGFRLEGRKIQAQYHDGEMKNRLDCAINKSDFLKACNCEGVDR